MSTETGIIKIKDLSIEAVELVGIEDSESQKIKDAFGHLIIPAINLNDDIQKVFTQAIQDKEGDGVSDDSAKAAKKLRIAIGKVRVAVGKEKDAQKKEHIIKGKATQTVHNYIVDALKPVEAALKAIEDDRENQEKARVQKIQEDRECMIAPYLETTEGLSLGVMPDQIWEDFFNGRKSAFEKKQKEEQDRIKAQELRSERELALRPFYDLLMDDMEDLGALTPEAFAEKLKGLQDQKQAIENKANLQHERGVLLRPYIQFTEDSDFENLDEISEEEFGMRIEALVEKKIAHVDKENLRKARQKAMIPFLEFLTDEDGFYLELDKPEFDSLITALTTRKKAYTDNQEQIRQDNIRLQEESDRKEKRSEEIRPYITFIRDYNKMISLDEKEYQKELAETKKGAEDHWEFERKEKIKKDDELKAAKDKSERLEKEAQDRRTREAKEKKEAEERIQAELNKGDAAKIKDLLIDVEALKSKYAFKSAKNKKMYSGFGELMDRTITFIKK